MHDKSCRFVNHQQIVILIYNIKRNVLGDNLKLVAWTVHYHLHHIQRFYPVVALYSLAIDKNATRLCSLLHAVAGRFLQTGYQKFVDT